MGTVGPGPEGIAPSSERAQLSGLRLVRVHCANLALIATTYRGVDGFATLKSDENVQPASLIE
ncbi:hypothetical protein GCM10023166_05850 [Paeniglutamicibacter cryotolerans]|uniref:Uncharacterized protein n=1 Tax=Paeniglutamicibacter cryotolerans TaxID=670079 RepID=A0A839QLG6_9MICC|nr:hypothetical protein [Paeniglutamicibacter cryotolerans]